MASRSWASSTAIYRTCASHAGVFPARSAFVTSGIKVSTFTGFWRRPTSDRIRNASA